jgi:hypothetical protein
VVPIVCVTVALGVVFGFVDGESVHGGGFGSLVVLAWWLSPLAMYYALCVTRVGAMLVGVAYFVFALALAVAIYRTDSSTAAIGLATVPVGLWVGTAGALAIERLALRAVRWSRTSRNTHDTQV